MADLSWLTLLTSALSIVFAAMLWFSRRRAGADRAEAAAREAELREGQRATESRFAEEAAEERHTHHRAVEKLNAEHSIIQDNLRASFEARARALRNQEERERQRAESVLKYARNALRWDQLARHNILGALEDAHLSAVVATNVMITIESRERPFLAQIDHVVFNERGVLTVEGKHWAGVTFDGVRPDEVYEGLAPLFSTEELTPPFAVNISRKGSDPISLRIERTTDARSGRRWRAPRAQARTQAARLQRALAQEGIDVSWISPVVYYSNPSGVLFAAPPTTTSGGEQTAAVGTRADLREWFTTQFDDKSSSVPTFTLPAVAHRLARWGGDLQGTGRYAGRWRAQL